LVSAANAPQATTSVAARIACIRFILSARVEF
jgi:hypothetical protein